MGRAIVSLNQEYSPYLLPGQNVCIAIPSHGHWLPLPGRDKRSCIGAGINSPNRAAIRPPARIAPDFARSAGCRCRFPNR